MDAPSHRPTERGAIGHLLAIIVTYNSVSCIEACLDSLVRELEKFELSSIVVVDNDSKDDTVAVVRERAPHAVVVPMGANKGYAAGINAGMAAAPRGDAVLVSNADLTFGESCLSRLAEAFRDPRVGVAVPKFVRTSGETQLSLHREPTVLRAFGEAILGGTRAGRFPALGEVILDEEAYHRPVPVAWASGSAWMISEACAATVGPWDESFFLYSEETDYALRVRDHGFVLLHEPSAVCIHDGGDQHTSPRLWALAVVNTVRLQRKRHGRLATSLFWFAAVLNVAIRSIRPSPTHRRALRALLQLPFQSGDRVAAALIDDGGA